MRGHNYLRGGAIADDFVGYNDSDRGYNFLIIDVGLRNSNVYAKTVMDAIEEALAWSKLHNDRIRGLQ